MEGMRNDLLSFLAKLPDGMRSMVAGERFQRLCVLGFEGPQLTSLGINLDCAGTGVGSPAMGSGCDCDCRAWELIQALPGCRDECDPKWKTWKCGPYLETGLGELDAETQRYQAEVRQLDLPDNVQNTWVYGFKISPPQIRARIWDELERYQQQQAEQDLPGTLAAVQAEQAEQAARRSNYDAETLRYQAALERAGYSQVEVDGLVAIFAPAVDVVRQVYWNEVNRKLNGQP